MQEKRSSSVAAEQVAQSSRSKYLVVTRKKRLERADFPTVLKEGRRYSSPFFTIVTSDKAKGLAVVVSKKVEKLSVGRHRIKRRVWGVLETQPLAKALIVYPKAPVKTLHSAALQKELLDLLSKTNR